MHSSESARKLWLPCALLGFSLGGFFDGILLHQILQWHHLLSNVEAARDMRVQLMADGVFHALMYVLAVMALYWLWRARAALAGEGRARLICGMALIGFGTWHAVDAVLSHWLLGIHRIRSDSPNPFLWDMAWLVVFGAAPLLLGWFLLKARNGGARPGPGRGSGSAALTAWAAATVLAGGISLMPAARSDQLLVVFPPQVSAAQAFNALGSLDARILWADRSGGVWAVQAGNPQAGKELYARGAWLVSSSAWALGCLPRTRAGTPALDEASAALRDSPPLRYSRTAI